MNDIVKIDRGAAQVAGQMCLDYINSVTDKTEERVEGVAHVFADSFKCGFWSNILAQTTRDSFFVTSDSTHPDDGFPYLRGNIIGWGTPSTLAAPHNRRGTFVPDLSFLHGVFIDGGRGVRYRYVYDFTSGQLLEGIGSFGLTVQYNPFVPQSINNAHNFFLKPLRERAINNWGDGAYNSNNVFKKTKNYRMIQSGIPNTAVVRTQTLTQDGGESFHDIDVLSHFLALGVEQGRAVGVAFDTDRAYLLMLSATASQRRLLEFADDTFTNLLNTYLLPTTNAQGALHVFAVHGRSIYAYHPTSGSMIYIDDFTNPADWQTVATAICPYNIAEATGYRSITIENGILYSHGAGRQAFFDIATRTQVANAFAGNFAANFPTLGTWLEPSLENPMHIHSIRWQYENTAAAPVRVCYQEHTLIRNGIFRFFSTIPHTCSKSSHPVPLHRPPLASRLSRFSQ